MTRFPAALVILCRILLLWASFYGAGVLLGKPVRKLSRTAVPPAVLLGLIACLLLSFPLSAADLLSRHVLTAIITLLGLYGCWKLLRSIPFGTILRLRVRPIHAAGFLILLFLGSSVFFRATKPQDHSDPLITYAVQPDRWLDTGHIFFLEETRFSAMPLLGETLATWPASLALPGISGIPGIENDHLEMQIDQLCLMQVFQLSLLVAATLLAWKTLDGSGTGLFLSLTAVLASSLFTGWGSLAKVDMTLAFFVTASFAPILRRMRSTQPHSVLWSFLFFGLALSTKITAWILFPFFLVLLFVSGIRSRRIYIAGLSVMLVLPAAYMARTFIHTSSLLYTGPAGFPHAGGIWEWTSVPVLDTLSAREDPGFIRNIRDLAFAWDYPLLLLLCGFLASIPKHMTKNRWFPLAFFIGFMVVSTQVFVPARWGAKYTIAVLPLIAASGASWWPRGRSGVLLAAGFLAAVAFGIEAGPRARFIWGFSQSSRMLTYESDIYMSPRSVQLWVEEGLPEDAVILSLFSDERYHSSRPVICARTHPYARRLFLSNSLQDEMDIMSRLGITHVCFAHGDPMGMNLLELNYFSPPDKPENPSQQLAFLENFYRGGGVLESLHVQDGVFIVCRVNYQ